MYALLQHFTYTKEFPPPAFLPPICYCPFPRSTYRPVDIIHREERGSTTTTNLKVTMLDPVLMLPHDDTDPDSTALFLQVDGAAGSVGGGLKICFMF